MEQIFYNENARETRIANPRLLQSESSISCQSAISRPICDLRVVTALRLVEAQIDQPITTTSLAESVGLSRFYFIRLFQDQVGETIMDYIRRIRLERSAVLLLNTSDSIVDIGFSVGYGSQSAFTRAFTQKFDTSPADYRRKLRQFRGTICKSAEDRFELPNIRVEHVDEGFYVARRYLGTGQDVGIQWDNYLRDICFDDLGRAELHRIAIVYDDDWITEPKRMRADLCLSMPAASWPAQSPRGKGFQVIALPSSTCAVMTIPSCRTMSDRDSGVLLNAWLGQQKRYRRRTGFMKVKFSSSWNASPTDQPDRILVPLDMV